MFDASTKNTTNNNFFFKIGSFIFTTKGGQNVENQNIEGSERQKYLLGWS